MAMGAMKEHTHVCKLAQRWSREGGGERDRKGGETLRETPVVQLERRRKGKQL